MRHAVCKIDINIMIGLQSTVIDLVYLRDSESRQILAIRKKALDFDTDPSQKSCGL